MKKSEYIIVWILTIITIWVIVWLIYSPLRLIKEIPALPIVVHQVHGDVVYAVSGKPVQIGDTLQIGNRVLATYNSDQLILVLSSRSFIHLSDGFDLQYMRREGFRLPVMQLNSGWMNYRRFLSDVRVPSSIVTAAGTLTLSSETSTWIRHPFSEAFITADSDMIGIHLPNGPARWFEEDGETTIRSGFFFSAEIGTSNRSIIELPQASRIVNPEDVRPDYFPGDLARGFTLSWRSEQEAQRYVVRIDADGINLPVLQIETDERSFTVSGLGHGSYMARVGNISIGKGVSRWSDGFPFSVSSRASDTLNCGFGDFSAERISVGERFFIVGCVPSGDQPVHIGVYALADIWYLQSGNRGVGIQPAEDGYFEISVVPAARYRVIMQSVFEPYPVMVSNFRSGTSTHIELQF